MDPQNVPLIVTFRLLLLTMAVSGLGAPAVRPEAAQLSPLDPRFGIIETYESPGAARAAGAAWTRVVFQWATTQAAGPESWTPAVSDGQIAAEIAAGRLVVGMLIGVPDWARDENRLPRGLHLDHDDPANLWAAFVRQATGRYAGRIDHWIIWNEPDIWDPAAPGHTWDGTVEEFAQLQHVSYLAAKEANPRAVIHLAALTWFWDAQFGRRQYLDRLLDVLAADPAAPEQNYYFDVLTAHLYFQPSLVYDVLQAFQALVAAHAIPRKPIWLVETNAPPKDDATWPVPNWTLSVILNEQAAFMPQAVASALAAGAERIAVYKLQDTESDRAANPEPFGLVRLDGSYRPAFTTFQVATHYMAGVEWARRERWDAVGRIVLGQGDRTTTVLFSRLPAAQQAEVEAMAASAVLVNMWGTAQTVIPAAGRYFINLPAAPCSQSIGDYCMIGGPVYYLVQPVDPAAPTVTATPTETRRPTHTPTAAATATTSATATSVAPTPSASPARLAATATIPAGPSARPAVAAESEASAPASRSQPGYVYLGAAAALALLLGAGWIARRR